MINLEESSDDVVVIIHPQLGKLKLDRSQLKTRPEYKSWEGSLALGMNGSNTGGDRSGSSSLTTKWIYKKDVHQFKIDGNWNYGLSRDQGDSDISIDTNKGGLILRYDQQLNDRLTVFASSDYLLDAMNTVGVHDQTISAGLGFSLFKNNRTDIKVSIGPSIQSLFGGKKCNEDSNCGRSYLASTLTTEINWLINQYFSINIVDRISGAYVNGITPSNVLSAALKIRPDSNSKIFTTLNLQTTYQPLQSPKTDNHFSVHIGTDL